MTGHKQHPSTSEKQAGHQGTIRRRAAQPIHPLALTIGQRLRKARLAAHLTQQQLASTPFSKLSISAIERGQMVPSPEALEVLANRLAVSISYLLGVSKLNVRAVEAKRTMRQALSEQERIARKRAALLQLSKVKAFIYEDQPLKAWETLGGSDEPGEELPVLKQPIWYWLAGWAAGLVGKPAESLAFSERGLTLTDRLASISPPSQKALLAEMSERLRCTLGNAYCLNGQAELAWQQHRQGLSAIAANIVTDPELKLRIFKGLGNDALTLGRYQEAIGYYQEATRQSRRIDLPREHGLTWWGLGVAYQQSGDLFHAKVSYQRALQALGPLGNLQLIAQIRAVLGQVLVDLKEYEAAEDQLWKSLQGARRLGNTVTMGYVLANLAALSLTRGNIEQAIEYANEGLQMARKNGDKRAEGQLHLTLASAYKARHDLTSTERAFQKAINVMEQTQDGDILGQAYEHYGHFLADQKRFQDAYTLVQLAKATISK